MATLVTKNGRQIIQVFVGGARRTIRLGQMAARDAQKIKGHVEHLANAHKLGQPIGIEQANWLAGLGTEMHRRIAGADLIRHRETLEIGPYFDSYLKRRTDLKQSTRDNWKQSKTTLVNFFGADRDMATITRGE